jgi:hypothetical protein
VTLDAGLRRRAIVRAMLRPDQLLAAALAELPDEDLAAAIGGDPARVWKLRVMSFPRDRSWAADVRAMAAAVDADALSLARLLMEVGVRP